MSTIVIALGGNAILQAGQRGTYQEQQENIRLAASAVASLIQAGHRVVVTHGNGPQVGNLLIQQEEAAQVVPPMPLSVCGAQTQGMLGYLFQQELANALRRLGQSAPVVTVVTQTEVKADDPAFRNPAKPVGPYYSKPLAEAALAKGWRMMEDRARGGWRRLVPSPWPVAIVEREAILHLVQQGALVVASGGGGVPVVRREDGRLEGVDAVIDKDLAGYRLAADVQADLFMILTDVPKVAIHFGTPKQENLGTVTTLALRAYQQEGHFKAGSMGPKVEAALRFAEAGGRAVIASLKEALAAVEGTAGTQIVRP